MGRVTDRDSAIDMLDRGLLPSVLIRSIADALTLEIIECDPEWQAHFQREAEAVKAIEAIAAGIPGERLHSWYSIMTRTPLTEFQIAYRMKQWRRANMFRWKKSAPPAPFEERPLYLQQLFFFAGKGLRAAWGTKVPKGNGILDAGPYNDQFRKLYISHIDRKANYQYVHLGLANFMTVQPMLATLLDKFPSADKVIEKFRHPEIDTTITKWSEMLRP